MLYVVPAAGSARTSDPSGVTGLCPRRGAGTGRSCDSGCVPAPEGEGPSFGVIDLASGTTTMVNGAAPTLSGDGDTLAYVARTGSENQLMLGRPLGPIMAAQENNGAS